MRISYKTKDMEMTPAIQEYADKRLAALDRFVSRDDESVMCVVELGKTTRHHKSGDVFRAEVKLHIAGRDLYAVSERDDLYVAIDEVKDEIVRQVNSYRNKSNTLMRRGASQIKDMIRGFDPRNWRK